MKVRLVLGLARLHLLYYSTTVQTVLESTPLFLFLKKCSPGSLLNKECSKKLES